MTTHPPIRVLFICTHNAARSIMAEACLNHLGKGRFQTFSAGTQPQADGQIHPLTREALHKAIIPTDGLQSKGWERFAAADAPTMDLVVTVCDDAAAATSPQWPGDPATAHWSYADPLAVTGSEADQREAFRQTLHQMRRRLELLVQLPDSNVDRLKLEHAARAIGAA